MKHKRNFIALVAIAAGIIGTVLVFQNYAPAKDLLGKVTVGDSRFVPILLVAALVDSINPCAFSILLLTVAFLFGIGRGRQNIIYVGGSYIFGIFLVYILIGLGILGTLSFLGVPNFMGKVGGAILVLTGLLSIIGHYYPIFPIRLKIPDLAKGTIAKYIEKASVPTALVLGVLVGMYEFPCTGGPYLTILGLLHDYSNYWQGFGYLVLYNLIFVSPLVVMLFIASNQILLQKVDSWRKAQVGPTRVYGGLVMVLLGLVIFAL
ncbi:MAG: cytochrome c biogenesis protein CcdA [Candidatus Liptonbacteria bacterium]